MSSGKRKPCPGCRQGSYDLASRAFTLHFRHHCHKSFLAASVPTSAKQSRLTYDTHSNPTVPCNPLMTSDTLTSSSFAENPFESEDSPPNPPEQESETVSSEPNLGDTRTSPRRPEINIQHDAANLRDKKRKAHCITNGSMHFQIQLVDILQKKMVAR